jgi:hypothetical protein
MANTTWQLESLVAKKLALGRSEIAAFRKTSLQKDRDWRLHKKQVELTPDAIDKISTALGTSPPAAAPDTAQPAPPTGDTPQPELVELQVARIYPNPRLLQARTAAGQLVNVAVPKNQNFRPPMRIKAHPPDQPPPAVQIYRLEGRCPRFPGRW